VQVDPIKPKLKGPGTKRLKLTCDEPLSNVAFKLNLRHYVTVGANLTGIAPAHFGGGGSLITLTGVGFAAAGAGGTTVLVDGRAAHSSTSA